MRRKRDCHALAVQFDGRRKTSGGGGLDVVELHGLKGEEQERERKDNKETN